MDKKYSKINEKNKRKSKAAFELAISTLEQMIVENKKITFTAIAKESGLSRNFYYKNEKLRNIIVAIQDGFNNNKSQNKDDLFIIIHSFYMMNTFLSSLKLLGEQLGELTESNKYKALFDQEDILENTRSLKALLIAYLEDVKNDSQNLSTVTLTNDVDNT